MTTTTDQEFNERCARAFGIKWHKEFEEYVTYDHHWVGASLPDFVNSPEWCWRAWEALVAAQATPWLSVIQKIRNEYTIETLHAGELRRATLHAFCEMKESAHE